MHMYMCKTALYHRTVPLRHLWLRTGLHLALTKISKADAWVAQVCKLAKDNWQSARHELENSTHPAGSTVSFTTNGATLLDSTVLSVFAMCILRRSKIRSRQTISRHYLKSHASWSCVEHVVYHHFYIIIYICIIYIFYYFYTYTQRCTMSSNSPSLLYLIGVKLGHLLIICASVCISYKCWVDCEGNSRLNVKLCKTRYTDTNIHIKVID